MSDFKTKRDQAAIQFTSRAKCEFYDGEEASKLFDELFKAGADWAYAESQAEIEQLRESLIVEQVGSMHYLGERDVHIKESETFVKDATTKINEQAKEIEQLKAEIERLRSPRKS